MSPRIKFVAVFFSYKEVKFSKCKIHDNSSPSKAVIKRVPKYKEAVSISSVGGGKSQ